MSGEIGAGEESARDIRELLLMPAPLRSNATGMEKTFPGYVQ